MSHLRKRHSSASDAVIPIDREWHEKNRMPKNPTVEQRVQWHLEHGKHCACRPIPAKLLDRVKELRRSRNPRPNAARKKELT